MRKLWEVWNLRVKCEWYKEHQPELVADLNLKNDHRDKLVERLTALPSNPEIEARAMKESV